MSPCGGLLLAYPPLWGSRWWIGTSRHGDDDKVDCVSRSFWKQPQETCWTVAIKHDIITNKNNDQSMNNFWYKIPQDSCCASAKVLKVVAQYNWSGRSHAIHSVCVVHIQFCVSNIDTHTPSTMPAEDLMIPPHQLFFTSLGQCQNQWEITNQTAPQKPEDMSA